jgi:hypothetical protein
MKRCVRGIGTEIKRHLILILCSSMLAIGVTGCAAWKAYWADPPLVLIPKDRAKKRVATYIKHVYKPKGGSYALYQYWANGGLYDACGTGSAYLVPGQKCMVEYDTLDPSNEARCMHTLLTSEPVFLPGEQTAYIYGEIYRAEYRTITYIYISY